ncbi:MAG: serine hydrolase domain-containing protein [Bacteroidota bacterium]
MKNSLILLLTLLLGACSTKETNHSNFAAKLDSLYNKTFTADQPGAAILVMKGDTILFSEGYGIADMVTKEPISTQTLFNLGSISKTFVANAVLMLQERGKLSIEDSIYKFFPHFKNKEIAQRIKIKHLLSHTSGLPDNREVNKDSLFYLTAKDAENWMPVTRTDTLVFEPGERYEYSNPAFNGLALIVEQVSGMKWQKFVEENILKPSGMNTSTITDGPHPASGVSHAYIKIQGQWKEDDYGEEPTFAASGNGGVWSSVEELAKYERALRNSTFLKSETIAQSQRVFHPLNWADATPPRIGWSWFIGQTEDSLKTVGHTGSQGGFVANYVTIPDKKILFVILCNTTRDINADASHVLTLLRKEDWLDQ